MNRKEIILAILEIAEKQMTKEDRIRLEDVESHTDFFNKVAPASARYHCSHDFGLLEHTYNVMRAVLDHKLYRNKEEKSQLLFLAFVHDLGKLLKYEKVEKGTGYKGSDWEYKTSYNDVLDTFYLLGAYTEISYPEKMAIAYHHGGWTGDGIGNASFINQIGVFLHSADLIASHIEEK